MEIFKKEYQLGEHLSTTELFWMLQEVSTEHCHILGFGMNLMGPKGLIWVVARHKLELQRYPMPNEKIEIHTWPGPARHGLFPRHYELHGENGEVIGNASALWTLVDINTRKMIKPENYGIDVPGIVTGREQGNPKAPEKLPQDRVVEFVVPEEYLDNNGHMNNTKYYKLAEQSIGDAVKGKTVCRIATEYANEALLGDKLKISIGQDENRYYVTGETDSSIFKMLLEYK
ncbi:MAG: hypothetical protein IJ364_07825 [Oscillospiraceae bacterium]|nr:hypothetical protein [Oscillospiraceae bacterium]